MTENIENLTAGELWQQRAEDTSMEYKNDELRELLYNRITTASSSVESEWLQGVSESGNVLKGVHLAEMLLALEDIRYELGHLEQEREYYKNKFEREKNKGLLAKLSPFKN